MKKEQHEYFQNIFSCVSQKKVRPNPFPLPLRFARSREGVGVSQFSFGWRGRGKGKGQIALQMKIFQDHTTNEGVWMISA